MTTVITNSGLANSSTIEPNKATVVVSGFGTGRTKDSKDKVTANGINNLKIVDSSNKIKQNGFSSFKVVPAISTGSFDERFNEAFDSVSSTVMGALASVQQDANNIKSTVLNMSNNLTTNYLSKAELTSYDNINNITSAIKEQTATFVTTEQAGGWYGLTLESDVNGKKYITGFDIGSIVYPESGTNDSYFRINADRFIVGGDIGDGEFGGPLDENGEPIPAFSIVQDGKGSPQMYFNGKVNIASIPESVNKMIGKFASKVLLDVYLAENPDVVVNDGDSYLNTSENIVYFWDGDEWISAEGRLELRSYVFKRSKNKPTTPIGGSYSNPIPAGWDDGIPAPTFSSGTNWNNLAVDPVWVSYALFDNKTDYTLNQVVWTEPEIMADTPTSDVMFNNSITQPPAPVYSGDLLEVSSTDAANGWYNIANVNAVWTAHRRKNAGVWTPWYMYKVKGESGNTPVIGVDYFISGSKYQATLYKEVVNGTNPSSIALPTGTTFNGTNLVSSTNGWTDDPVVSDATGKYLVVSTGLFSQDASTGNWALSGTWSTPQKYTIEKGVDFFDGASGTYTSYIYKVGTSVTTPNGGSFAGDVSKEVMPSGWVDNPSYGIDDVVWVSSVVYQQSAAGSTSWAKIGNWSTPTRFYVRGNPGARGPSGANGKRGSAILHGSGSGAFSSSAASSAFNSKFGYPIPGDQFIWSSTNYGTVIRTYTGSIWVDNTALTVHGDAVIDGTLVASKLIADYMNTDILQVGNSSIKSAVRTNAFIMQNRRGTSTSINYLDDQNVLVVGDSDSIFGNGIYPNEVRTYSLLNARGGIQSVNNGNINLVSPNGRIDLTYPGVAGTFTGSSSGSTALIAKSTGTTGAIMTGVNDSTTKFIVYNTGDVWSAKASYSFTGAHFVLQQQNVEPTVGDILETDSVYTVNVNTAIPKVKTTSTEKSTRVYGVFNGHISSEFNMEHFGIDDFSDYERLKTYLSDNVYDVRGANAIGEGCINVCDANGDIENGDYICSSNIQGKGMRQDDDLLHNYTVAKSLESVIWENEVVGINGCFEQDGVKCKMVACTYHCG